MHPRVLPLLLLAPAYGSQRIAGYLDELADCSVSSTGSAGSTSSSGAAGSTDSTRGTTDPVDPGTTEHDQTTQPDTAASDVSEGTTTATTGEPLPTCGNGVREAFGPLPEECDDGNQSPDDGCSDTCTLDIRVFVSSMQYNAGDLEGVHLADASCINLAAHVGEPEFIKYRAWLSDSATDARDHIKVGRGRIILFNGLVLADSWDALLAGQLQNPIDVTEKFETYHGGVWTGTRPDGTAVPGSTHCDDWTSFSVQKTAYYGDSSKMNAEWTLSAMFDNPSDCAGFFAIYCFKTL